MKYAPKKVFIIKDGGYQELTYEAYCALCESDSSYKDTHVFLPISTEGLRRNSIVLLEQVRTIDRSRLGDYIGRLDENAMEAVNEALAISIGIEQNSASGLR